MLILSKSLQTENTYDTHKDTCAFSIWPPLYAPSRSLGFVNADHIKRNRMTDIHKTQPKTEIQMRSETRWNTCKLRNDYMDTPHTWDNICFPQCWPSLSAQMRFAQLPTTKDKCLGHQNAGWSNHTLHEPDWCTLRCLLTLHLCSSCMLPTCAHKRTGWANHILHESGRCTSWMAWGSSTMYLCLPCILSSATPALLSTLGAHKLMY